MEEEVILIRPAVEKEDIDQEIELLKLEGKVPSRAVLYKKFSRYEGVLFDSIGSPDLSGQPPWASAQYSSLETINRIVDWSLVQSDMVQSLVLEFLDSEIEVDEVITILVKEGVITKPKKYPKLPTITLTDEILALFSERREIHIYDLYEMAREFNSSSKRPEAAVRQIIRRLVRSGVITKEGAYVYCLA